MDFITWQSLAFFIFSVFTLGGGLAVVTQRNLFHAALSLMLSLFGVAGLFVLLVAPFLAAVQVLVYIGAIAVLVLFAIMLTRRVMGLEVSVNTQWQGALVVAVLLFVALLATLTPLGDDLFDERLSAEFNTSTELPVEENKVPEVSKVTVTELGLALSTRNGFVLPFEIVSLVLTAALIGAIVVAREDEA